MVRKKILGLIAAAALVAGASSMPALARGHEGGDHGGGQGHGDKAHPAQTRMRFNLDEHHFTLGDVVGGVVTLQARDGKAWVPMAGAVLDIAVDGPLGITEDGPLGVCAPLVTDAYGQATAACTPSVEGDYVMKVRYAGDETHRKAQRAQGFQVGTGDGEDDDTNPMPEPSPTM